MFDLSLILILILMNGVFAMTEAAVISSRRPRLESMAAKGSARARLVLDLIGDPSRFLSTVQIGITLIGIGAGALGEKTIADKLEPLIAGLPLIGQYAPFLASVAMVLILTYVWLILGELVPKRVALAAPEAIAQTMAPPMRWLAIVAAPLVKLLSVSTNLLLALLPSRTAGPEAHAAAVEDEVRSIIASGAESGVFHESQQRIVERVFRLADQTVDTLMVPRTDIDYLNADDSPARVRVAVATSNHSHFPVCRPGAGLDGLLGTVHVKDLVKSGLIADDIRLSDLVRPPLFVPESTPALRVLELFKSSRTTIGFVTDEYGALEGLVTVNDLVEAIVGEVVRSTADIEEPMVVRRPNGSMLVDGMLPVEDLRAVVFEGCPPDAARTLPNEAAGYRTLAGFILTNLGRIPASGDVLDAAGCRFEVVDMDRRRIDKVLMTRLSPPAPAAESTSAKGGTAETSPAQ